ncbi:MAG: hypothetical protein ACJ780_27160 [Solirubrobacteraceae bacterium]
MAPSQSPRTEAPRRAAATALAAAIGNRAMARLASGRAKAPPRQPNTSERISRIEPAGHAAATALAAAIGNRAMARLAFGRAEAPPRRPKAPERILARNLIKDHHVPGGGTFALHLMTQSVPGAKSGLEGTITFTPDDDAPDSKRIRLFQAAREVNMETGKDVEWTDDWAPRMQMETTADADKGIEAGWAIDADVRKAHKRTYTADPDVSPFYGDSNKSPENQDGAKAGHTRTPAALWDFPGTWTDPGRFSLETIAVATDTGHVYGAVDWGFTVSDVFKGTVTDEHSAGRPNASATVWQALKLFKEYYRNRGTSTAPTTPPPAQDWHP